jgi:GST-like protein
MIELYYWPTPNGHKITMSLEEAGLDYTIRPINISAGDQFKPDFLAFSPNNRKRSGDPTPLVMSNRN